MLLNNGQQVPVTGWWATRCGHRLFLLDGNVAPACPKHVTEMTWWRLVAPVGAPRPFR